MRLATARRGARFGRAVRFGAQVFAGRILRARRAAPAFDHRLDERAFVAQARRAGRMLEGFAARNAVGGQRLELQSRRQRQALAEADDLARAERGHEGEQIGDRVGHRRAQQRLIAIVGHAHREQRVALGDDGGIEFGRTLGDEAEIDAVFAPLLGDAQQRAAGRRETDRAVGGREAMRLLADEQHRHRPVAPQAEIEGEPADDADHRVDDLDGKSGDLHDRHRLAVRLQPEQIAENLAHRVAADIGVLEHEAVARVVAQAFDARQQWRWRMREARFSSLPMRSSIRATRSCSM